LQEVPFVFAKGELWFRVPDTVQVRLTGQLSEWVTSKDIVLHVAGRYNFSPFLNRSIEYCGEGLKGLSLAGRMVLSNMAVDLGAKFAIAEFDDVTASYLAGRAVEAFTPVAADADAPVAASLALALGDIRPLVAHPDGLFNVSPATECRNIRIDQAFIGTCTNGRLEDLQLAARVLRGRRIASHVRMIVTPASQAIFREMARSGLMETFLEAGAVVTNSTCGACMGLSMGVLGDDEVCISSGSRNFKGRMGSASAKIYLASPATVAASAIAGEIIDPDALR
jgi:homoaconitase/3-isopropylmalate dehydratase large subunit